MDSIKLHSLIFKVTQKRVIIFYQNHEGENKLVYKIKALFANITLINPMPKYPHIIELFACILNMFFFCFYVR